MKMNSPSRIFKFIMLVLLGAAMRHLLEPTDPSEGLRVPTHTLSSPPWATSTQAPLFVTQPGGAE